MKIEGSHIVLFLKSKVKFAVFLHKLYEHLSIPLPEVGLVSISTRRGNSSMPVSRFGPKGGSISSLITSLGEHNIGRYFTYSNGCHKKPVNYVLDGGQGCNGMRRNNETLKLPGSTLQQLAL